MRGPRDGMAIIHEAWPPVERAQCRECISTSGETQGDSKQQRGAEILLERRASEGTTEDIQLKKDPDHIATNQRNRNSDSPWSVIVSLRGRLNREYDLSSFPVRDTTVT